MLDIDIFRDRAKIPHPLGQAPDSSSTMIAVHEGVSYRVTDVFGTRIPMLFQVLASGAPRVNLANELVSNTFSRVWAEKFGSVDLSQPEGLLKDPDDQSLAQKSLIYSEQALTDSLRANISEARRTNSVDFSCFTDTALGVRLVAAGPKWHKLARAHGVDLALDVVWGEARVPLATGDYPATRREKRQMWSSLNNFTNNLAQIEGQDEFDTYRQATRVVGDRIKVEQPSPLVAHAYRVGIGPDFLRDLRGVEDNRTDRILVADWLEANLGDPEISPQRVIVPPSVDGFFVNLGASMLREFFSSLSQDVETEARSLRDRHSWSFNI